MSQKTTRRSRRQTYEEETAPAPTQTLDLPPPIVEEAPPKVEQNGTGEETVTQSPPPQDIENEVNGHGEKEEPVVEEAKVEEEPGNKECVETEMDPLIIGDEADPELVFEENSDIESGKGSPILNRCKTRRSLTRNIPTPKTPKSVEEDENISPSPTVDLDEIPQVLNESFGSCSDNLSTNVEVGGDSTRLDYMDKESSSIESNSFIQATKNKSFGETLKHLSKRRSIRPVDDYRRKLLQANFDRNSIYPSRNSVERLSVGGKRKNTDVDEEDSNSKRYKTDSSPGFFAKFTSPLNNIRNPFKSDVASSTPKLTGYKDDKFLIEDDGSKMCEVNEAERRWCSIM